MGAAAIVGIIATVLGTAGNVWSAHYQRKSQQEFASSEHDFQMKLAEIAAQNAVTPQGSPSWLPMAMAGGAGVLLLSLVAIAGGSKKK